MYLGTLVDECVIVDDASPVMVSACVFPLRPGVTRQREDDEVARLLESTKLDLKRRRAAWALGGHGSESRKQIRLDLIIDYSAVSL